MASGVVQRNRRIKSEQGVNIFFFAEMFYFYFRFVSFRFWVISFRFVSVSEEYHFVSFRFMNMIFIFRSVSFRFRKLCVSRVSFRFVPFRFVSFLNPGKKFSEKDNTVQSQSETEFSFSEISRDV
jgi:hypothetical protein